MSSFVTNKYVSRIDQGDFDKAIGKLSYEIQHRKQEFLGLCTKYDKNYNKRQIESLYKENKAKNVINILEKSVRDMFYIYCNDISFDGFKTLKDDLVDLRIKMGRNEEEPFIQKYLDKYKEICCNLENIFLKKTNLYHFLITNIFHDFKNINKI